MCAAIRLGAIVGIDADRLLVFADAVDAAGDMEFGAEHDPEEAVDDLFVREGLALGKTPLGDFRIFLAADNGQGGEMQQRGCEHKKC